MEQKAGKKGRGKAARVCSVNKADCVWQLTVLLGGSNISKRYL